MKISDRILRDEERVKEAVRTLLARQGGPYAHSRFVFEMILRNNEMMGNMAHD